MCPPCRRAYVIELHEQRALAKRKVDPVHEVIVDGILEAMSPEQLIKHWQHRVIENVAPPLLSDLMPRVKPVTEGRAPVARLPRLSDDTKLEVGRRYEEGQSYDQIRRDLGVSSKTISTVAREMGLTLRGTGYKPAPPAPEESVPEPVAKAIENMVVLPPKPEPLHSTPLLESFPTWEVRVEGIVTVHGGSIEEALASVRKLHPALRITGIVQAQ